MSSAISVVDAGDAVQRRSVDDREVELLVGRVEVHEQVEHLIYNPVRACAVTVNLVDDHDRLQTVGEGLLGHEAGLRHRPSIASTTSSTESTIDITALPRRRSRRVLGIHDVDTVTVPINGGVFARMVIPRSFSKSLESITRSVASARSRKYRIVAAACQPWWFYHGQRGQ